LILIVLNFRPGNFILMLSICKPWPRRPRSRWFWHWEP